MSEIRHLFYIHGFNSSPKSTKARLMGDYLAEHHPHIQYHVPALVYDPAAAMAILQRELKHCESEAGLQVGLVGSSLGGYYGTWLANEYKIPLVLVNPAVCPYRLLKDYIGENENIYTGEKYTFTEAHIDAFKTLEVSQIEPKQRYFLITQTGDEVLDYSEGVEKFAGCPQIVQRGGSHGFEQFERVIPNIMTFFGIQS